MKLLFAHVLFLALVLVSVCSIYAFDIAVYSDARSGVNWRSQTHDSMFCRWDGSGGTPRATVLGNIQDEQQVFDWFAEMGVNYIIPYYPFASDFTALLQRDRYRMKILNASYPHEAFKYMESQYRVVWAAELDSDYVNNDRSSWGENADTVRQQLNGQLLTVLEMQQSQSDTMWQPQSELGIWNGWSWREAWIGNEQYMPMHYRVTCNLDTFGSPPGTQSVASFYWLVKNTEGSGWWRYPEQILTVDSFRNGPDSLDVINFVIDTHPDMSGTFTLVNDEFEPPIPTETATSHAYGRGPLDEERSYHAYGGLWGVPVRICVFYQGHNHTFQIYKVDVWDEGYHKLFVSADTTTFFPELRTAFQQQYSIAPDTLIAGWYYDEWQQPEQVKSYVKVNKILQTGGLPTMPTNGHFGWDGCAWCFRNRLFDEAANQGVNFPIHMDEFYFLSGSGACRTGTYRLWTNPSSDATYLDWDECGYDSVLDVAKIIGQKSLQCGIDEFVWGDDAFQDFDPAPPIPDGWSDIKLELVEQVRHVHSAGKRFWAMIQGDDDDLSDSLDADACCTIRRPSPTEVKLGAWLSVACNADGILWYPVQFAGGLLEWNPDLADNCGRSDNLAHQPASVETTDRYDAAREVGNDIRTIVPILDSLVFVKTYASRAYQTDYPDSAYEATQRDILATNCNFFGTPYRSVEGIVAWAPNTSGGWQTTPETNPYVQVSRFRNRLIPLDTASVEDYWFLIVNRRALENERRKIRVVVDIDSAYMDYPYYIDYILGDSTNVAGPSCAERIPTCATRYVDVILEPGEAELVNFFRGQLDCPDIAGQVAANVDSVTARRYGQNSIMLRWAETTLNYDVPFQADVYFIYGSSGSDTSFIPIGFSTSTSYVDSLKANRPRYYYQVGACGDYE